ncbi:MAG TPA: Abi-alpha family protein [Solirubrobacterales bacterium]|nr:Abi-alpha family protein [Solirubrobacterales bacterium]
MPGGSAQPTLEELAQAAPGLARIAASMAWHGASEVVNAYAEGASRVMRAASQGESTAEAVQETTAELRAYLRELIGVQEGSRPRPASDSSTAALRRRGEELLRQSADVSVDVDSHPAYMRILDALAPDEGRILRFLAREGAQPSVDVRSGLPFASELVAQGCTMIAEEAGCRHADRVYAYLNNLHRLGLVWFSREALRDARRYQVLEAQGEVTEALERGGRTARTVRRSIVLTPFGEDFCAICLPLD